MQDKLKERGKRLTSLLLVLSMIFTMLPAMSMTAQAASTWKLDGIQYQELPEPDATSGTVTLSTGYYYVP